MKKPETTAQKLRRKLAEAKQKHDDHLIRCRETRDENLSYRQLGIKTAVANMSSTFVDQNDVLRSFDKIAREAGLQIYIRAFESEEKEKERENEEDRKRLLDFYGIKT